MATAREPSDVEQLKRYIATQRLDGDMDSLTRAQLALGVSVPTALQKLFSKEEILHVIRTVARAIDEAVDADRIRTAQQLELSTDTKQNETGTIARTEGG